jgi:hypothetical protein
MRNGLLLQLAFHLIACLKHLLVHLLRVHMFYTQISFLAFLYKEAMMVMNPILQAQTVRAPFQKHRLSRLSHQVAPSAAQPKAKALTH